MKDELWLLKQLVINNINYYKKVYDLFIRIGMLSSRPTINITYYQKYISPYLFKIGEDLRLIFGRRMYLFIYLLLFFIPNALMLL